MNNRAETNIIEGYRAAPQRDMELNQPLDVLTDPDATGSGLGSDFGGCGGVYVADIQDLKV